MNLMQERQWGDIIAAPLFPTTKPPILPEYRFVGPGRKRAVSTADPGETATFTLPRSWTRGQDVTFDVPVPPGGFRRGRRPGLVKYESGPGMTPSEILDFSMDVVFFYTMTIGLPWFASKVKWAVRDALNIKPWETFVDWVGRTLRIPPVGLPEWWDAGP